LTAIKGIPLSGRVRSFLERRDWAQATRSDAGVARNREVARTWLRGQQVRVAPGVLARMKD